MVPPTPQTPAPAWVVLAGVGWSKLSSVNTGVWCTGILPTTSSLSNFDHARPAGPLVHPAVNARRLGARDPGKAGFCHLARTAGGAPLEKWCAPGLAAAGRVGAVDGLVVQRAHRQPQPAPHRHGGDQGRNRFGGR